MFHKKVQFDVDKCIWYVYSIGYRQGFNFLMRKRVFLIDWGPSGIEQ